MFLFRKKREASVRVIEPGSKKKKKEKLAEDEKLSTGRRQDVNQSADDKESVHKNIIPRAGKKSSKSKNNVKELESADDKKVTEESKLEKTISENVTDDNSKEIAADESEQESQKERPIQVITSEQLVEEDDDLDNSDENNGVESVSLDDEDIDSLLVPGNPDKKPDIDDENSETEEETKTEFEQEEADTNKKDVSENEINNVDSSAEPEIKKTDDSKEEEKEGDDEEEGGGNLFASLFGSTQVVEETPLDKLINSLPEITIEEVINEAEDVNNIIHDWYQQQINRH